MPILRVLLGLLSVISLPAFAFAADAPALQNDCQSFTAPLVWSYCVSQTQGSSNVHEILYVLHGGGGDQHLWIDNKAMQGIRQRWADHKFQAPTVVTVSFDGLWLLAAKNASSASGLYEFFTTQIMPQIEKQYVSAGVTSRKILGFSMGGFNGSLLVLKMPQAFESAVLVSPAVVPLSPYSPTTDIAAFVAASGSDPKYFEGLLQIASQFYPDEKSWETDSPLYLGKNHFSPRSPRLLITRGAQDHEFLSGDQILGEEAKAGGADVEVQIFPGGHMNADYDHIADFLATKTR